MLVVVALAGCGGGAAVDRAPGPPPCETVTRAAHPADTVTVVLFDRVDLSHAPWGQNREERFVFSHLYETLVTIDCHGVARTSPLTKSIVEASDGWLIELRDGARFWDDTPVTSQAVQMSLDPSLGARDGLLRVFVIDERSMIVKGRGGLDIKLLALPMFAVVKRQPGSAIPIGTGDWAIDTTEPVRNVVIMQPATGESPVVRFVPGSAIGPRDVVDGTADAVITDDPSAIEYARDRKATLAPLAWDRSYVFISPTRLRTPGPTPGLAPSMTDALARDVVAIDARGGGEMVAWLKSKPPEMDFLETGVFQIPAPAGSEHTSQPNPLSRRVLYVNGDRTAQSLAERLVAIAAMDGNTVADARALVASVPDLRADLQAIGVSNIKAALDEGLDFGYVMGFPRDGDFPFIGRTFMSTMWISSPYGQVLTDAILPLVETRAHFVALSDHIGFIDDHAGSVRILIQVSERGR